jgi:hypothetical protein
VTCDFQEVGVILPAPKSRVAASTVVPLLAGATVAAAGVLLLGWPDRPPLPGQAGALAAVALMAVAVLLVFVPTLPTWRRSYLVNDRAAAATVKTRRPVQAPAPPVAPDPVAGASAASLIEQAR